ncbi:hypothetical protein ES288_A11G009700v1 [Gossypium darwinii]|uniref:Uncharacterized protein n=1 Tax=Gossypium darwinii TaxID=34276 RepID=A0A5D2EEY9_GOSDA|nr:hypothetical protein ES288_A11G009700v1 [Gossypium darwinii]
MACLIVLHRCTYFLSLRPPDMEILNGLKFNPNMQNYDCSSNQFKWCRQKPNRRRGTACTG